MHEKEIFKFFKKKKLIAFYKIEKQLLKNHYHFPIIVFLEEVKKLTISYINFPPLRILLYMSYIFFFSLDFSRNKNKLNRSVQS